MAGVIPAASMDIEKVPPLLSLQPRRRFLPWRSSTENIPELMKAENCRCDSAQPPHQAAHNSGPAPIYPQRRADGLRQF